MLIDGKLWIWGKGDGGRLGFGHENTVFRPTVNSNLESVRSIALGGLHSVALDSLGHVFSWSVISSMTLFVGSQLNLRSLEDSNQLLNE